MGDGRWRWLNDELNDELCSWIADRIAATDDALS